MMPDAVFRCSPFDRTTADELLGINRMCITPYIPKAPINANVMTDKCLLADYTAVVGHVPFGAE